MLLREFFGPAINLGKSSSEENPINHNDDLFHFIINHDKLHKDHFMPLGLKIKKLNDKNKLDHVLIAKELMPMVDKGCNEYCKQNKIQDKIEKVFPKETKEELCQKLLDHYIEAITKKDYNFRTW